MAQKFMYAFNNVASRTTIELPVQGVQKLSALYRTCLQTPDPFGQGTMSDQLPVAVHRQTPFDVGHNLHVLQQAFPGLSCPGGLAPGMVTEAVQFPVYLNDISLSCQFRPEQPVAAVVENGTLLHIGMQGCCTPEEHTAGIVDIGPPVEVMPDILLPVQYAVALWMMP